MVTLTLGYGTGYRHLTAQLLIVLFRFSNGFIHCVCSFLQLATTKDEDETAALFSPLFFFPGRPRLRHTRIALAFGSERPLADKIHATDMH